MPGHIRLDRNKFRNTVRIVPTNQRSAATSFLIEALMRATYEPTTVATNRDVFQLERGQFVMGLQEMSKVVGCSMRQIRTVKKLFENSQILTSKTTNRGQTVTVIEYDAFVGKQSESDKQNGNEATSKRQAGDNKEEVQEVKEVQEEPKDMSANDDVVAVYDHFKRTINDKARLTKQGQDKIKTRLKVFTKSELVSAMDNISNDEFFQQHNATRPIAWFFHNDERIETYIHKVPQSTNGRASTNACPGCKKELVTRQYPVGNPRVPPDLQGVPIVECGRGSYRRKADVA